MRLRMTLTLGVTCWWLIVNAAARGQSVPFAPFSPTDPKVCANYAAQVERYSNELTAEHERCLHVGKEDRPNLPPDSPLCSRNACQYLHDELFSDYSSISVKVLRKRVGACNAEVKEYLDRQAAEKRQAEEREQAVKNQESAEESRNKQEERQPGQTRISPTPASQSSANNAAVLPPSQQTGQAYSVGSMKVPDTPQTEQARQAAKDREQKDLSEQALNEVADPFARSSGGGSSKAGASSSDGMVDPFGDVKRDSESKNPGDSALADPFSSDDPRYREDISDAGIAKDKAIEIAIDTIKNELKDASKRLAKDLEAAKKSGFSPVILAQYESEVGIARNFLDGMEHTITTVGYAQDINKWIRDPKNGWGPVVHDMETGGFSEILKQVAPSLSKVYEGPIGWAASITLESSSTQTPVQDFDPMTVLNSPGQYSFDQRVAALQKIYVSEGKHPEVWNASKCRWLFGVTVQVYNSPDNPNIHLAPQDDPNIQLTPQ